MWGNGYTDHRGDTLEDFVAAVGLYCLNIGNTPTFERRNYGSVLDVTFTNSELLMRSTTWEVLDEETLSDHRCIAMETEFPQGTREKQMPFTESRITGWRFDPGRTEELHRELGRQFNLQDNMTPETLVTAVTNACKSVLPHKKIAKRQPVYWWTPRIAELRRACIRYRRLLKRHARGTGTVQEEDLVNLATARRTLRKEIVKSKSQKWKELCESVNEDVWGDGYKIVSNKLGRPLPVLQEEMVRKAIAALFPVHDPVDYEELVADEIPLFTKGELEVANSRMKPRKAAGLDGIPPEVTKYAASSYPDQVLQAMNYALAHEEFPDNWKVAKLVLLRKGSKPVGVPSSYRPLCLLSTPGKLMEHLLLQRLNEEIARLGGLSENQYGFRTGLTTIDAINRVVGIADRAAEGTRYTRRIAAILTLDIRNAFNSASWRLILAALKQKGISPYLRRMIQKYLQTRKIMAIAEEGKMVDATVTSGVPQGSVLGPTLWNILYDGVLRVQMPEGTTLIGYADDLAMVVRGKTEEEVVRRGNSALRRVDQWLCDHNLQLAPEKTEAVIMAGRRVLRDIVFNIGEKTIIPKDKLKYLGVWLDRGRTFQEHIRRTAKKCAETANSLSRLMANVGGPSPSKRKLLATVVTSKALYAAPIWIRGLEKASGRDRLERIQRKMALRICSAYRTVSLEAAFVVAGTAPLELLAKERVAKAEGKEGAREATMLLWQQRWSAATTGMWTRRLIQTIKGWVEREHGEVNYFLTQFLTGHGCFRSYLHKMKRAEDDKCRYCQERDTPEHTIFVCTRWDDIRVQCPGMETLNPDNIIGEMLLDDRRWNEISSMITSIMKAKCEEE